MRVVMAVNCQWQARIVDEVGTKHVLFSYIHCTAGKQKKLGLSQGMFGHVPGQPAPPPRKRVKLKT